MGEIFCLLRMAFWAQLRGNFGAVDLMVNLISCQCNIFIKNSKAAVFEEKELSILRSVFVCRAA